MPLDRFLIAPINTGLQTDLRPWLIPEDAFVQLDNAYVFRGRVRKRFGSAYMGTQAPLALSSRLAVPVGTTNGSGNISGTVPGSEFNIGQGFSIGSTDFYTVYQEGTPGNMLRNDGVVATATFNTTNGAFVINGGPASTGVYWYPSLPVMGLALYEIMPINNQPAYAFDTEFAYVFADGYWQRSGTGTTPQWHGTDTNFFWIENWDGETPNEVVMYVTNFNATVPTPAGTDDPVWYFDGTNWARYSPYMVVTGDGTFIQTAQIIVAFKGRLLMLNTIEQTPGGSPTNASFVNRCRYSIFGSPFAGVTVGSDFAAGAWLEVNQSYTVGAATAIGNDAGFVDAGTEESIVSAEFIKDRLIVYFERSTWELAFTNNQIEPFVWQKINTELGSESPNSTVPFDRIVLTVGSTGVHACNGSNVERIDNKIPDQIFKINTQNQQKSRVCGIRDYYVEMVYWSYPSDNESSADTYPNRVLVYNYRNDSWAINDDCITAFGYFEQAIPLTWERAMFPWETANFTWDSGVLEAQSRQVIAGNQQGFVFYIQPDNSQNAAVMQLTNVAVNGTGLNLTIINHTLHAGDYIYITQSSGFQILNPAGEQQFIFQVSSLSSGDPSNTVFINPATLSGSYTGGSFVARVSQINILSKQWNPYVSTGRNVYIAKIDFGVLRTSDGEVTVDYYPSYTQLSMIKSATANNMIQGTSVLQTFGYILYPLELIQDLIWHPIYFQTEGEAIQINISLSNAQMIDPAIVFSDFELQGMVLHTQPTTTRLQ